MLVDDLIFVTFRLLSAGVLTAVTLYLTWKLYNRHLTPAPVWLYTTVILWVATIFRWFVVWVVIQTGDDVDEALVSWLQPITQTMYVLMAMAIFVLTFTHIKERRLHYRVEHGEDPSDE